MNEEEIENRILICKKCERDYREVDNSKRADKYRDEIYKWEQLLNKLDPKRDEQLRDYKAGYNQLKLKEEKLINYLESMLDCTINDEFVVTGVKQLLEKVKSGKYE